MNNIKTEYNFLEKGIQQYIELFEKKHDLEFDYWIGNSHGEIAVFGDYYFNFTDIRLDLEQDEHQDNIFQWYDITLERNMEDINAKTINYKSWTMGLRYDKL